jgi:hypothetical protein
LFTLLVTRYEYEDSVAFLGNTFRFAKSPRALSKFQLLSWEYLSIPTSFNARIDNIYGTTGIDFVCGNATFLIASIIFNSLIKGKNSKGPAPRSVENFSLLIKACADNHHEYHLFYNDLILF